MKLSETLRKGRGVLFSRFVLQLLFILFVVEFVKGALLITFLPFYMKNALGASTLAIGWTLAAQYIGDNLLRTPLGWVIDRWGYRLCMLGGTLLAFVGVVLLAVASGAGVMVAGCALLGIGTAPLWPCVVSGSTSYAGDKKSATVLSVVYLAWLTGVGLGPVVITFFMDGKFHAAFRLLLGLMAAAVPVALFLPGALGVGERSSVRSARSLGRGRMERIRTYMGEVNRALTGSRLLFPAMFLQTFALGLLTPILTIYATNVLGLSQAGFRTLLLVGGAVTVLLMLPCGKLVDRFGPGRFLYLGFLLGGASLLAFPFARGLPLLYAVVLLLGLAYALIIPAWNAQLAAAIPPDKRGAVWGFFLTIEGLGTTIAPIVSGYLWDAFGPHAPFRVGGSVLLALLALQVFLASHKREGAPEG